MQEDIFEKGTRLRVRYDAVKGQLSIEDLWQLPLTSKTAPNLDDIAKACNRELKAADEESFVTVSSAKNQLLQLKLDIVRHIINVKLAEKANAAKAVEVNAEKTRLLAILAQKQEQKLLAASEEDIQKMINNLG